MVSSFAENEQITSSVASRFTAEKTVLDAKG
jgi:hypothetical protein